MTEKAQLKYLRKRSALFLEFIVSKSGKSMITEEMEKLTNKLFASHDLQGLKAINKEFDRWSKELPKPEDSIELYSIYHNELGEDFKLTQSKKLKTILKKGIYSLEDYQLVQDRVNQIFQQPNSKKEMEILNALLREYENRKTS